jgi:hemolysin III
MSSTDERESTPSTVGGDGAVHRGDLRERVEARVKPRLRGWLHFGAAPLAFVMGLGLLVVTPTAGLRLAVAVYVATTVLLFGVSASYHLGAGGPRTNTFLNRLDHANIYLFIAGSYTPFAAALDHRRTSAIMLVLVWTIALVGLVIRVWWRGAPRWLAVGSYLALGWVAIFFLPVIWSDFGAAVVALIALGGMLYSIGGVVYARKRPDPYPEWFGYHEVFHALTIAAFLAQYVAIAMVVA